MARLNLYRPIPSDPSDWFDADEIDRARAYNRPLQLHGLLYSAVVFGSIIAMTVTHAGPRLISAAGFMSWPIQLIVAVAAVLVVVEVLSLPFDLWKERHEVRWDLRVRRPLLARLGSAAASLSIGFALSALVALAVWALIRTTSAWWILAAGVAFLFVAVLGPAVIGPLVVRFVEHVKLVEDEDLRRRVRRVTREAGTDVIDVFQSEESRRSSYEAAYFIGFGRARKVVLSDNLLRRPHREIDVVLAHIISRIRRRHAARLSLMVGVLLVAQFGIIRLAAGWEPLLRLAGVSSLADPAALPLFLVLFFGTFYVITLVRAWLKRAQNRESDLDSLEFTRDAEAFASITRGMYVRTLGDLAPSLLQRIRSHAPTPSEQLALGAWWQATRRVTVLFTDIENSTALLESLGDEGWYELRRDHNEIIRERVTAHEGIEVDSAGDGFLIVFEDAGEALLCAVECQRALAGSADTGLRVRMGLHAGDVIRKGREVVGREVHVAARVASCASGGEILVSASVRDALQGTDRFTFEDEHSVELKGFSGSFALWRVSWTPAREPAGADRA